MGTSSLAPLAFKHPHRGTSLAVQWLRHRAGASGSIPGRGTKITQAAQRGRGKKKKKKKKPAQVNTAHRLRQQQQQQSIKPVSWGGTWNPVPSQGRGPAPHKVTSFLDSGDLTAHGSPAQAPAPRTPKNRGKALSGLRVPWGHSKGSRTLKYQGAVGSRMRWEAPITQ